MDYPPLTAYHSLLLGTIANWINPDWIALGASHGIETPELKLFMRITALVTELICLTSAVYLWIWCYNHRSDVM